MQAKRERFAPQVLSLTEADVKAICRAVVREEIKAVLAEVGDGAAKAIGQSVEEFIGAVGRSARELGRDALAKFPLEVPDGVRRTED